MDIQFKMHNCIWSAFKSRVGGQLNWICIFLSMAWLMPKHSRLTWSATTTQRLPPILFACLLKSLSLVSRARALLVQKTAQWQFHWNCNNLWQANTTYSSLSVQSSCVPSNYIRVTAAKGRLLCSAWCWNDRDLHIPIQRLSEWVPGTWYCPQRLEMAIPCSPIYFAWRPRVNPIAICDLLSSRLTHKSTRAHHRELTGRWCRWVAHVEE